MYLDQMDSPPTALSQQESCRNWLDLPEELVALILARLGVVEILVNAQRVCSTWYNICKDPYMWRSIDMHNSDDVFNNGYDLQKICRHAVDRSAGELQAINIEYFATDELLHYITDRSNRLKCLRLVSCYSVSDKGLCDVAEKLPLLEDLDISYCSPSKEVLDKIGQRCPLLRSFKLNNSRYISPGVECDEEALAIAKNMPGLRHLQIFGNRLTNCGLLAILDGCPHLESLDLRQCFNVNLEGHLGRTCAERIKELRHPYDSIDDSTFDPEITDILSSEDDYPYGFSDIDLLSDDDEYYEFSCGSDFSDDIYFD